MEGMLDEVRGSAAWTNPAALSCCIKDFEINECVRHSRPCSAFTANSPWRRYGTNFESSAPLPSGMFYDQLKHQHIAVPKQTNQADADQLRRELEEREKQRSTGNA